VIENDTPKNSSKYNNRHLDVGLSFMLQKGEEKP